MPSLADSVQAQIASFAERLQELRLSRGWTLDQLAERSDLSKSYLSRLESGDRQVSIAAAMTLAAIFRVSVASLFEPPDAAPCVIVRAGGSAAQSANGLTYWPMSCPSADFQLQPLRVVVAVDRAGDERQRHDGEEWLYVLSGALTLSLDGEAYELEVGDAAHFDARLPHRLIARGRKPAEVLLVAVPRAGTAGPHAPLQARASFSPKPRVQLQ